MRSYDRPGNEARVAPDAERSERERTDRLTRAGKFREAPSQQVLRCSGSRVQILDQASARMERVLGRQKSAGLSALARAVALADLQSVDARTDLFAKWATPSHSHQRKRP